MWKDHLQRILHSVYSFLCQFLVEDIIFIIYMSRKTTIQLVPAIHVIKAEFFLTVTFLYPLL